MPTARKSTRDVTKYPVIKDGYYEIIKGIPTNYDYPSTVTLILFKNKVLAIAYNGLLAKPILKTGLYDPSRDITGKYGLNKLFALLNNPNKYPNISFRTSDPQLVELLPSSILKTLGISRESIKREIMGNYYKKYSWEEYLHSISYR
ncbi:MAG: hypothetical protein IKS74_07180 [Methanomicrobium sp.]|nr:hypothetical protein [Methanomicrobium sp.]